MVTAEQEIALAYLLDPAFQIVNTAGKPLTDGWIEVYIHGTRNKYYCYSDWNGALHPFQIPLDSLGSNIVLASPDYAYDIYIYNKFGSLVMSRYNVSPGNTGGNSGGGVQPTDDDAEHWLGQYGATQPLYGQNAGQTLALPSNPDYHGNFVDHIEYGTINPEGGTAQYPKYMYLNPGLYLVNCVIRFQQKAGTEVNRLDELLVYTGNGNANEDVAWQLDETGPLTDGDCRHCLKMTFIRKVLDTGETSPVDCSNVLYFAPSPKVDWKDAYIQTLQIVKLGAGFGSSSASGGVEYKAGPGISIDIYNNISVTGMQPASSMGDYVTYEVYNEFVNNVTGDLEDLQREIDYVSSAVSGGGQVYTAGQYVSIQGNEISVTGLQPEGDYASQSDLDNLENVVNNVTGDVEEITNIINNVTGDITNLTEVVNGVTGGIEQLNEDIQTVSAAIPESEEVEFEELDLSQFAQASAVTGLEAQIQEVSSAIPDVTEITNVINNVTGDVQNLTNIVENVTGDINNLETIVNNVTGDINVLETNISNVTGDVTNLTEIVEGVTGDIEQLESDIQAVSAAIPPAQVQSDWTQDDDSQVDYIKNKPEETDVVAGPGISIVESGSTVTISTVGLATSGDVADLEAQIQTVSAAIPTDVVTHAELAGVTGDYATNSDLQTVSAAVDSVSAQIPESEEVDFEELDLSQYVTQSAVTAIESEIQTVSSAIPTDTVTHAELAAVTGDFATEQELQAVSAAIPDAQVQSDWTEANTSSKAFIQHKPQQTELIAGQNIYLTDTASGLMISAEGGSVTGDYVTHDELAVVTGDFATEADLQTVSGALDAVSAAIPDAQVNADWTAVSGKAEILNKPDIMDVEIKQITAGENVTITETASAIIISAQGGGTVTGDYATNADLQTVSAAVDAVSAEIPASEEVEFEEIDLSQFVTESAVTGLEAQIQTVSSAIPDISGLATEADLQTVSGAVDEVSGKIPSQIEVEFKELDLSQFVTASAVTGLEADIQTVSAAIPDVSNFATDTDVSAAVSGLQNKLTGITDVVVTNSLPASPVATVLYLIPEA